jgi:hypothetical protein
MTCSLQGFGKLALLASHLTVLQSHHMHLAMWHCKELPLGIHNKIIFMIVQVDVMFTVFILQGSTINETVNLTKMFQFTRKKAHNLL